VIAKTSAHQGQTPLYQTETTSTFDETSFDQARTAFFLDRTLLPFDETSIDRTKTTFLFDETSADQTETTFWFDETSFDQTRTPPVFVRTPFCFDETSFNKTATAFLFDETSTYETTTACNKINSSNDYTEWPLSKQGRLFTEQERPSCPSARPPTNLPRPMAAFTGPSSTSSRQPVHQKGAVTLIPGRFVMQKATRHVVARPQPESKVSPWLPSKPIIVLSCP
jgi:hypothetical protein